MYCCERFDYFDQGKLIEIIENKVNICIMQEKIKTHKELNLLNPSPSLSPT